MSAMTQRSGFSLIEVIIAMLILSVAVLAMGASTGYIFAQVRGAELRTERMMAVRQAAEQLRAAPWDQLNTRCAALELQQGQHTVTCSYDPGSSNPARLQLTAEGPNFTGGTTTDTYSVMIQIARPL